MAAGRHAGFFKLKTECMCFWTNRRKRQVNECGNGEPTAALYLKACNISSDIDHGTVPDEPINLNASWPTQSNITMQQAIDLCDGVIKNATCYEACCNYTVKYRMDYIDSCVEDIKVTASLLVF